MGEGERRGSSPVIGGSASDPRSAGPRLNEYVADVVRHVCQAVHGGRQLRILVLGDPHATTCHSLVRDGHDVWCCPDLQRGNESVHTRVVATTVEELMKTEVTWDLIVAVEGFRRLQRVHSTRRLKAIMDWIADSSHAAVVEAPRVALAPDLHDLGPYLVTDLMTGFLTVTEIEPPDSNPRSSRPLLFASSQGLLLGETWLPASALTEHTSTRARDHTVVRTFESADIIIKVELGNEGYFEQCDAVAEGAFLMSRPPLVREELGLPRVIEFNRGRAVNVLVRERIDGVSLWPGACRDERIPVAAVIDAAVRFSKAVLFHNDFRPWNLLWTGNDVVVIDYANVCDADLDVQGIPQILALAGTLAALMTTALPWGEEFAAAVAKTARRSRIGQQWTEVDLLGTSPSPWLSLDAARHGLVTRLGGLRDPSAPGIVELVIEEIMAAHLQNAGN